MLSIACAVSHFLNCLLSGCPNPAVTGIFVFLSCVCMVVCLFYVYMSHFLNCLLSGCPNPAVTGMLSVFVCLFVSVCVMCLYVPFPQLFALRMSQSSCYRYVCVLCVFMCLFMCLFVCVCVCLISSTVCSLGVQTQRLQVCLYVVCVCVCVYL